MFCDDLSFDGNDASYKSLKAVLEGGIEGRPDNVILYATSNRRHLLPRDMMENERSTAINPGEAVEEKVSLSDRFGLWLGFHKCSQDEYLGMVDGYCEAFRAADRHRDAASGGARMGRRRGELARPRRLAVYPRCCRQGRHSPCPDRTAVRCGINQTRRPVSGTRDRVRPPLGSNRLTDFEVELRRGHVAGLTGLADHSGRA